MRQSGKLLSNLETRQTVQLAWPLPLCGLIVHRDYPTPAAAKPVGARHSGKAAQSPSAALPGCCARGTREAEPR